MPNLYIISGCNGAGKTTASFTILPEMLNCYEFINADEIAKGLSPLNPDKSAIEAGRIMLSKIDKLIHEKADFAFETTLATRSYVKYIEKAKVLGYKVTLLYFWLDSIQLAIERVKIRVLEGGHNIPDDVIERRYYAGVKNFFQLYCPVSDYWLLLNNSQSPSDLIAEGYSNQEIDILNTEVYTKIKSLVK
ncbi:MAG: zeta toxin [Okeania sp. SIO3C4]|nr:zeta toxin [Okeania sp. SIO3C4]